MNTERKLLWGSLGLFALIAACCLGALITSALLGNQVSTPTQPVSAPSIPLPTSTPVSPIFMVATDPAVIIVTATPASTITPVPAIQNANPAADLQALIDYTHQIKPVLEQGLAAAERDGQILQAADQNQAALCGGELLPHPSLAADAVLMDNVGAQLASITAPAEAAAAVHRPLQESVRLWAEALDNINRSCETADPAAQGLLRLGATLQLGGAMLNFHVASDNYWRLIIINGLEAIAGPQPEQQH